MTWHKIHECTGDNFYVFRLPQWRDKDPRKHFRWRTL